MYDFAFDKRNLNRELNRADFMNASQMVDEAYRSNLVQKAQEQAANGFLDFSFSMAVLRGKPVYQIQNLAHELVLRKFSRNIRRLTKVKQADRNTIIKSLKQLLSEGHHFRVYKLDLKSFYESIDRSDIERQLKQDNGLPPPTLRVFQSFSAQLSAAGIPGLPRGLPVSADLSEYIMRHFDQILKSTEGVYYYARYVDDIIILTTGEEDKRSFLQRTQEGLPAGVTLNHVKTNIIEFAKPKNNRGANIVENYVDFLGYRFAVHGLANNPIIRKVTTDISPNKEARFKTRIVLSALQFTKDKNFNDFFDRLRILTGNYNVYDRERKIRRNVGIYYNYRFVDGFASKALKDLDVFLKRFLLATNGRISQKLAILLSKKQKRQLLTLSFCRSFDTRSFYHFPIGRLTHLVGCWVYE